MEVPAALGAAVKQGDCPEHLSTLPAERCAGDLCCGTGEMELVGPLFLTLSHPSWCCCFLGHRGLVMLGRVCSARESKSKQRHM